MFSLCLFFVVSIGFDSRSRTGAWGAAHYAASPRSGQVSGGGEVLAVDFEFRAWLTSSMKKDFI
jgi:hypothetical protein